MIARFRDIAHCHALNILFPQEVKHHPQPLRAYSNKRNVDFVTGRNVPLAAQYMTWNNRECCCSSCALLYEIAAGYEAGSAGATAEAPGTKVVASTSTASAYIAKERVVIIRLNIERGSEIHALAALD